MQLSWSAVGRLYQPPLFPKASHFPVVQVSSTEVLFFLRSADALQLCIFPLQLFPYALFSFFIQHSILGVQMLDDSVALCGAAIRQNLPRRLCQPGVI